MEAGAEGSEEGQAGALRSDLTRTSPDATLTATSPRADLTRNQLRVRLTAAAPFGVVSLVGLWLSRSFWFPGRYVVSFDGYAYSGPNLEVTERALRSGRLPVLNDLIFGGVPHLGNPSALALYPLQVLTMPFETNRAMGLLVTSHLLLLGLGMLVLARRLGLTPVGATVSGVVAVASGSTLTKSVQFEQILVIAWIPLLLATIHAVLMSDRPWRAVAALSAVTAAVLLAGHPQLVYQSVALALAATIGFAWDAQRWRRIGHLAIGALLGVGIALPQLVAVLYATADSAITGGRELEALRSPALSLPTDAIARALLGTVQDRDPAEFASGFESIAFIGVVVALLVVIGVVHACTDRSSRPWAISLAIIAALSLAWATGPRSPLFRLAFDVVPGFDLARASSRWLVIVVLVATLFAGIGVDVVWSRTRRRHVVAAVVAAVALALLLAVGPLAVADRRSGAIWAVICVVALALIVLSAMLAPPALRRGAAVGLLVVAAVELGAMSMHSVPQQLASTTPFTAHRSATTEFLRNQDAGTVVALTDDGRPAAYQVPGMRPNANVLAGVASIDGYDGGVQVTARWADALRRITPDPPTELPLRNSLSVPIEPEPLARMGVRWVLLDRNRPPADFLPGWSGPVASDDDFEVWENPSWRADAVAWPSAVVAADPAAVLRDGPAPVADVALVSEPTQAFACTSSTCGPIRLDIDRPRPEQIELSVDVEARHLVSVTQQALPGWTVHVDGRPADVVVVDGLFLGVEVPPGDHEITFRYRSPWMTPTLVMAMLALAATISLLVADSVGRSRRITQDAGRVDR